jgi:hypothetical protein
MKAHIDKTKGQLSDLSQLAAKTEQTERNILSRAEQRLQEVQDEISQFQAGIEGQPEEQQQQYLDLIQERGQLHQVISRAKSALAE